MTYSPRGFKVVIQESTKVDIRPACRRGRDLKVKNVPIFEILRQAQDDRKKGNSSSRSVYFGDKI